MSPWVTPDDPPGETICIKVYCPSGVEYEAALRGAISNLSETFNWEKVGTQTVETVSDAFAVAFDKTLDWDRCMPIGGIIWFAGAVAPSGMMECNGASLSKTTYPDLFNVIGYTYGGSGDNFNLPNIAGRFPVGSVTGGMTLGIQGGASQVTLTTEQIPAHDHQLRYTLDIAQEGIGVGGILPSIDPLALPWTTSQTGGNQPHQNLPPFIALRPIIQVV